MYKCVNCGKTAEVDMKTIKRIICPFCGQRILKKERPKTPKRASAI